MGNEKSYHNPLKTKNLLERREMTLLGRESSEGRRRTVSRGLEEEQIRKEGRREGGAGRGRE